MTEWIKGFFDFTKQPPKILAVFALVSGTLLFAPLGFRHRLALDSLPDIVGKLVGLVFLFSVTLVALAGITWLVDHLKKHLAKKHRKAELVRMGTKLDWSEKRILREFVLQRKHAVHLPSGDSEVVGLVDKGILRQVGSEPIRIYYGAFLPYMIDSDLRSTLTVEMLGFPGEDVQKAEDWLITNRPPWIIQLEEHMSRKLGKQKGTVENP